MTLERHGGREHRRLSVIMFTDIVGFSTMAHDDESRSLELLAEHTATLRPIFTAFDGTEIKATGDGFLVEFGSAVAAVECAIEIQKTLRARNEAAQAGARIQIRVGLHLGDVVFTENDVLGDGVNIAARVQALAEPEGVCVSQQVFDQVRGKVDAAFSELRAPRLKNVDAAIRVYAIRFPWTGQARGLAERLTEGIRFRIGNFRIVITMMAFAFMCVMTGALIGLRGLSYRSPAASEPPATAAATPPPVVQPTTPDPAPPHSPSPAVTAPPNRAPMPTAPVPTAPTALEKPAPAPITAEDHARQEIHQLLENYCAALSTLNPATVRNLFHVDNERALRDQYGEYTALNCTLTSRPEFDRLDAGARGAAHLKVRMKQRFVLRSDAAPRTVEFAVTMAVSRVDFQGPWLIDRVVYEPATAGAR